MMKFLFALGFIIVLLNSCENKSKNISENEKVTFKTANQVNQYIASYSGSYIVLVNGSISQRETEGYALKQDGTATWLWIENNVQNGATVRDKKYGTWEAEKDKISISISGNTGNIIEKWINKNGTFVNKDNPNRSLLAK